MTVDAVPKIKVEKCAKEELERRGVFSWPVWEKAKSKFDWSYDTQERCYFLEGDVTLETKLGKVHVQKGDFVTFSPGLSCVWDIRVPVKKHYTFG